ncbi:MAG: glycoside hydrolase family 9 protein, partial [Victivallales bacterium]|nr:glycoside hydrolase family 9 protein [Victivallales bacterium]
ADADHFLYLLFRTPFQPGESGSAAGCTVKYDPEVPSRIFKLNQLGNGANQKRKFAYLGAWLGNAGALPLKHLAGKDFEVRRADHARCVYRNVMTLRRDDPLYQQETAFTGEEVLELDYSAFNVPGRYYLFVDGIGRSMDFAIGSETLSEAFFVHARGLYHKRCGIAKTQPFTAWESPLCHSTVSRGRFPGSSEHYRRGKDEKDFGFFDSRNARLEVKHFELIKENPPYRNDSVYAPGGWHDAADYDRRPQHLRIACDLAMVYLMKPENFIDGQLNIPESGNGIPDVLDEASWGLRHLLAVQQPDGGVGTWFETTGHPAPGEGLPDKEERSYYISAPSRNGSLEYAAAAAALALAVGKAGADAEAEKLLASAVRAWDFAMNPKNRLVAYFRRGTQMLSYMEAPHLYGENLLKAAALLFALTGERKYLEPALAERQRILAEFSSDFWKWSPLTWMCLEICRIDDLSAFASEYRKVILRNAGKMLAAQENAYPYRTLWHEGNDGWVHAMSWGNYHPLRRAMTLIAAHRFTGEEKYLTGAYLANDFHNGANPLGRSMTSGLGRIYPAVF